MTQKVSITEDIEGKLLCEFSEEPVIRQFNEFPEKHVYLEPFRPITYEGLKHLSQPFPSFVADAYMDAYGIDITQYEASPLPLNERIKHHLGEMGKHIDRDGRRIFITENFKEESNKRPLDISNHDGR